jgi:hypothetical protein
MPRWINLFGTEKMFCVAHADLKRDALGTSEGLLRFLNLPMTPPFRRFISDQMPPYPKEPTPEERLASIFSDSSPRRDKRRVMSVLEELRDLFAGEYEWLQAFRRRVNNAALQQG